MASLRQQPAATRMRLTCCVPAYGFGVKPAHQTCVFKAMEVPCGLSRQAHTLQAWVHSYVSADKTLTFCIYDAPNPDAIRRAAQRNVRPIDRITELRVLDPYFYC